MLGHDYTEDTTTGVCAVCGIPAWSHEVKAPGPREDADVEAVGAGALHSGDCGPSGDVGAEVAGCPKCGSQTPIGHPCIVDDLEAIRTADLSETPIWKAIAAWRPKAPTSGDVGADVAADALRRDVYGVLVQHTSNVTRAGALAAFIAVRVEAAKAEALREAADAVPHGVLAADPSVPAWLRRRAAALDSEATQ